MESSPLSFTDPILPAAPPAPALSGRKISHAAGLDDLRQSREHSIAREIRVWLWNENGSPFNLYRFVDSSGRKGGAHFTSTL